MVALIIVEVQSTPACALTTRAEPEGDADRASNQHVVMASVRAQLIDVRMISYHISPRCYECYRAVAFVAAELIWYDHANIYAAEHCELT